MLVKPESLNTNCKPCEHLNISSVYCMSISVHYVSGRAGLVVRTGGYNQTRSHKIGINIYKLTD